MYKSEAASWFRIFEMFKFQSFHMYGLMGSALFLGIIFSQLIKRFKIKSFSGEQIKIKDKELGFTRYFLGGLIFGLGWALAGACPGPIYTLIGAGYWPILIVFFFALLGTYLYGILKRYLPH